MNYWTKYTTLALAALAVAVVGCSEDSPGQPGGSGGTGGGGTGGAGDAFVRVAHLAPGIPAVDICVNGEAALTDLSYSEATDRTRLDAGTYNLAVATVGGCPGADADASAKQNGGGGNGGGGVGGDGGGGNGGSTGAVVIELGDVPLPDGTDVTLVAYADSESDNAAPVDVAQVNSSLADLESGKGRVFAVHGADSAPENTLTPIDVVALTGGAGGNGGNGGGGGDGCLVLVEDLVFGAVSPALDLDPADYTVGLLPKDAESCPAGVAPAGGIALTVADGQLYILVPVVEEDGLEVWALVGTEDAPARTINTGNGNGQ